MQETICTISDVTDTMTSTDSARRGRSESRIFSLSPNVQLLHRLSLVVTHRDFPRLQRLSIELLTTYKPLALDEDTPLSLALNPHLLLPYLHQTQPLPYFFGKFFLSLHFYVHY